MLRIIRSLLMKIVDDIDAGNSNDNYVREGKLPKGKHEIGFKELSWSKKDLDEFVRKSRDSHSLLNNVHNRVC